MEEWVLLMVVGKRTQMEPAHASTACCCDTGMKQKRDVYISFSILM